MSQEMFEPKQNQPQKQPLQNQPQGWEVNGRARRDRKSREMPKNEHPSTFEEPFPRTPSFTNQSQEAMDSIDSIDSIDSTSAHGEKIAYQAGYSAQTSSSGQHGYSPDGDAMESGYRHDNAYQPSGTNASSYVPPWARPQQHNPVLRILLTAFGIFLLAMLVLQVIFPLFIAAFVLLAILIIIVGGALLLFSRFVLSILRMLGVRIPLRPARFLRRRGKRHHMYFDV